MLDLLRGFDLDLAEERRQRAYLRRVVGLLLLCALALAMLLAPLYAADTYSASDENGKLTLTKEPCAQHPWLKEWKLARWFFQGKPYEACWNVQPTRTGGQMVVVIDSAGVVTPLPPQIFRMDEGV